MPSTITRLKRRREFLRVAAARRKWVAPGLILQARRRAPEEADESGISPVRVGFTVSRKVGNAVRRNRARRRLRSAAELILPFHAREGNDYVVIGRGETLRRPFAALLDDFETALKRLDAYRASETGKGGRP